MSSLSITNANIKQYKICSLPLTQTLNPHVTSYENQEHLAGVAIFIICHEGKLDMKIACPEQHLKKIIAVRID
jgi:hypothetical protein